MKQHEFEFKGHTYVVTHNGPHTHVVNKNEVPLPRTTFDVILRVTVSAKNEEEALEIAQNHYVGDLMGAELVR